MAPNQPQPPHQAASQAHKGIIGTAMLSIYYCRSFVVNCPQDVKWPQAPKKNANNQETSASRLGYCDQSACTPQLLLVYTLWMPPPRGFPSVVALPKDVRCPRSSFRFSRWPTANRTILLFSRWINCRLVWFTNTWSRHVNETLCKAQGAFQNGTKCSATAVSVLMQNCAPSTAASNLSLTMAWRCRASPDT